MSDKERNFRRLEDKADRATNQRDLWKTYAGTLLAESSGLNPDLVVTGMAVEEFLQDKDDPSELTLESFRSFAEDFGVLTPTNSEVEHE